MISHIKITPLSEKPQAGFFISFFLRILKFNLFLASFACQSMPEIPEHLFAQDYYFTGNYVQITGNAPLPPAMAELATDKAATVEKPPHPDDSDNPTSPAMPKTGARSVVQRRKLCIDKAIKNSYSKWLGLTRKEEQDQAEWILRLGLGVKGPWDACFQKAQKRYEIFDRPDGCTVVMLYPCLPQEY